MMTYSEVCKRFAWPAAKSFILMVQQIVPVNEAKVFLIGETKSATATTYDIIMMTDYLLVEAQLVSNDETISDSNSKIKIHSRNDVSVREIRLNNMDALVSQSYREMHVQIIFKDGRDPIHIDRERFNISPAEFMQIASLLTK